MAKSIFRREPTGELGDGDSFVTGTQCAVVSENEFFEQHLDAITQGVLKTWDGGSWISKPLKTYLAGSFQIKPVKLWNGTTWITLT